MDKRNQTKETKVSRSYEREGDAPAELECQFIMRMPPEPSRLLREALRSGVTNLRDRFGIKIELDVRHGEVRVDHWLLPAKIVDLPTIVESLKTIDNKSFYKTADVCQMLLCKEEDDQTTDEESTVKTKKKDPNKVDKKFLWPHGVTPPSKNIRRRRFRKTLKKKYVEAPEIEKEVKRLLRVDNDAVSVKWEVICEDEDHKSGKVKGIKKEKDAPQGSDVSLEMSNQHSLDVAEHDIFGGAVSDSEDDEAHINVMEMDENSRLTAEDSRLSDTCSIPNTSAESKLVTEFTSEMFNAEQSCSVPKDQQIKDEFDFYYDYEPLFDSEQMSAESLVNRLEKLESDLTSLRARHMQQVMEIENIENPSLRQRFQEILDQLSKELNMKEQEHDKVSKMLKGKIKEEKID